MTDATRTENATRLCMNCKHFRTRLIYSFVRFFGGTAWCEFARCAATPKPPADLVCGDLRRNGYEDLSFCSSMRSERAACKTDGQLWEPR